MVMRKYSILNRILSFSLALALLVASSVNVYAVDESSAASIETVDENIVEETVAEGEVSEPATDIVSEDSNSNSGDASSDGSQNNSDASKSEDDSNTEEEVNKEESTDSTSEEVTDEDETSEEDVEEEVTEDEEEAEEEDEEEDGAYKKSGDFEVTIDGYTFVATVTEGTFKKPVKFEAVACTLSSSEERVLEDTVVTGEVIEYTAFDMHFLSKDGEEIQPSDEHGVKISAKSDEAIEEKEVIHISDSGSAESVDVDYLDEEIAFELQSFSKIVFTDTSTNQILYNTDAYGSAIADKAYIRESDIYEYGMSERYHLRVYYTDGSNLYAKKLGNSNGDYAFNYKTNQVKVTFYAPDNYVVSAVYKDNVKSKISDTDDDDSTYTVDVAMNWNDTTDLHVELTLKTSTFDSNASSTLVNGATIARFNSNYTNIANTFAFNSGNGSGSNQCHYGQVYQGLASNSIEDGFKLADSSAEFLFPSDYSTNSTSYSYITRGSYHTGVSVEFKKDTDGYWTIDSNALGYRYDSSNNAITTRSANGGFWPYGKDETHFGMVLPINFNINSNGKMIEGDDTSDDTIFRFSGDDDVFVYINNTLVLDLGGIHSAVQGQINFATGEITIQGHNGGNGNSSGASTLTNSNDDNVYANKGIGTTNLYTLLGYSSVEEGRADFSKIDRQMTVVYFERGANQSNCRISYNFTPNKTTTATFTGMKINSSKEGVAGAKFKLFTDSACTVDAGLYTATSDSEGTITFSGLTVGSEGTERDYYVKEIEAATGYAVSDGAVWRLHVSKQSDGSLTTALYAANGVALEYSLDEDQNEVADYETEVKYIYNFTEDELSVLELDKSASVVDYENRVYRLDLEADYSGKEVVETEVTTEYSADVVMVMDASGSMVYTDAPIVSASSSADAYLLLSNLDTSKIYFTSSSSGYGYGVSVYSGVGSRLLSGARSGGKYYGLPDSGEYLFYADGWYKRSMYYRESFWSVTKKCRLASSDWNSTYYATKLNSSNCPTTIYTNRSEIIQNAAKNFVKNLDDGSNVAIVSFNNANNAVVECGLTNVGNGSSTIASAIGNIYGSYNTATHPYGGLEKANNILNNDYSDNAKYVIFFTDGANDGESVAEIAEELHEQASVYAIGAGAQGSTLSIVASDENHVIAASSVTELASSLSGIATTIVNELRPKTGKGTVTDYIDSRFEACDASGNLLSNGAKVGANGEGTLVVAEDGSQSVVWNDASIGTGNNKWSDYIYVKAKSTFFGGNKVVTNGPGSNVSITGDKTKYFPQPTVNVKLLDFTPEDAEITLWLGDTITGAEYSKWLTENTSIPEDARTQIALSETDIATLVSDGMIVKDYSAGGEKLGSFTLSLKGYNDAGDEIVINSHTADKTGKAVEKYVLSINYTAIPVADRTIEDTGRTIKSPVGTEVTSIDKEGTYIVNVVTGALDVLKRSKSETGTLLAGATYSLEKEQNGNWVKFTDDVTSDSNGLMAFTNMGVGKYRLTEISAPSGYAKSNIIYYVDIARNTEETEVKYDITVSKNETVVASFTVDSEVNASQDTDTNLYTCILGEGVVTTGFNVVDQIAYTLPETGGSGVYVYTIGGILLMIAGALLLYKNKNNKNK